MAEKPITDWPLGLSLYVQGQTHAQIAAQLRVTEPCLRQHIHRHGWKRLRTEASALTSRNIETPATKPQEGLAEKSASVRMALANDLAKAAEKLTRMPHTNNVTGFHRRAKAVSEVASTAKEVFGWGSEVDGRPMVRIAVMNLAMAASRQPRAAAPADPAPVVDVTPPAELTDNPDPPAAA